MPLSTVGVWQDGRPLGNSIDVTSFHPNDRPTLSAIVRPVNRTAERLRSVVQAAAQYLFG